MGTAEENVDFVRAAYHAMQTSDLPWMQEHTHPDVLFQQGGRFPTAGTSEGREAMFGHFYEFMGLVGGDFALEVHDVLGSDRRAAAYITVTLGMGGEKLSFDELHLWRIEDGQLVEMRAVPLDPYVVDEFFSAAAAQA